MNKELETVCKVCSQIKQKINNGISFQTLLFNIRKEFRDYNFEVKILTRRKSFLEFDEYYVNAYYDSLNDEFGEIPIEIIIFHNFDYTIGWDKSQATQLLIQIFDALIHEFKHQHQSQQRKFKTCWRGIPYLEDPDEIDAYAVSIAIELLRSVGKLRALRYLSKITLLSRLKIANCLVSPNLYAYLSEFDITHPISKKIAKKIFLKIHELDSKFVFM